MFRRASSGYTPAPHLVSSSFLTAEQLVTQFEDFQSNIRHVSTAPELVFERLVGNLSEAFNIALERERQQHGIAPQPTRSQSGSHVPEPEPKDIKPKAPVARTSRWWENLWGRGDPPPYESESGPSPPEPSPPEPVIAVRARKNPAVGGFNTYELRTWREVRHNTWKVAAFARSYTAPPGIPIGLDCVDIGNNAHARVKSYTSNIRNDNLEIHLDSWEDTKLYSAGCAWLEIEAGDSDFQFGSYNTIEDHPWYRPQIHNSRQVAFARPYTAPPTVVVWLTAFDLSRDRNWRIKTFATDVTKHGFTIHIDTWSDSTLYSAVATWVAYPSDKLGICSGRFSTLDFRSWRNPQMYNSKYEKFGSNVFTTPPRTLLALDSLDIDKGRNLRLRVKASEVAASGMTWHLDAWEDTILYSAGASYIALR